MNKLYLLLILLIATTAQAEIVPEGCYIETGSDKCFETTDNTMGFYTKNILPEDQDLDYYGQVVASLLEAYWQEEKELKAMTRKYHILRRKLKNHNL